MPYCVCRALQNSSHSFCAWQDATLNQPSCLADTRCDSDPVPGMKLDTVQRPVPFHRRRNTLFKYRVEPRVNETARSIEQLLSPGPSPSRTEAGRAPSCERRQKRHTHTHTCTHTDERTDGRATTSNLKTGSNVSSGAQTSVCRTYRVRTVRRATSPNQMRVRPMRAEKYISVCKHK